MKIGKQNSDDELSREVLDQVKRYTRLLAAAQRETPDLEEAAVAAAVCLAIENEEAKKKAEWGAAQGQRLLWAIWVGLRPDR